ncbi:sulfur oxidation c-type cytochrome SoxX [Pseudomonadota bacterium]|nr:sulfur oxidation c-type cytochrome SoxX [Xanthomonadales bacterium]
MPIALTLRTALTILLLPAAIAAGNAVQADPVSKERLAAGKKLAMTRSKGNCLACHAIDDGELPGSTGPPLMYMQQRYPERSELRAQVWDATVRNPDTMMPPFGRHLILSEDEIDLIVDYIHSL